MQTCLRAGMYIHTNQWHEKLVHIYLSGIYLIFFVVVKLHFIYILAGEFCTSLGCFYVQHHSAAYQPLNLYRTANTKRHSLTEHIFIPISIISDFPLDCMHFPLNIRFKALVPIFKALKC